MGRSLLAANIRALLATGQRLTADEIAKHLGCHPDAARNCLSSLQRHRQVVRQRLARAYVWQAA